MSFLVGDTPIIECLVRSEMFYDQAPPASKAGKLTGAYIFGFLGRATHAPAFQIMTEEGAQWARVPLHMLCWKPCEPAGLELLCWWDCFSNEFAVHEYEFLRGHACTAIDRAGTRRPGNYLFTVEWRGRWAEVPDQHKEHHFLKLDSGHFAMYPNNKILWHDASWIKGLSDKPDWKVNTHEWSIEGRNSGTLRDTTKVRYE